MHVLQASVCRKCEPGSNVLLLAPLPLTGRLDATTETLGNEGRDMGDSDQSWTDYLTDAAKVFRLNPAFGVGLSLMRIVIAEKPNNAGA
jgi:hypothetical protein